MIARQVQDIIGEPKTHVEDSALILINDSWGATDYVVPVFNPTLAFSKTRALLELPVTFPYTPRAPCQVIVNFTNDPCVKSAMDATSIGHWRVRFNMVVDRVVLGKDRTTFIGARSDFGISRVVRAT